MEGKGFFFFLFFWGGVGGGGGFYHDRWFDSLSINTYLVNFMISVLI